jgi:hypothetical protein
VISLSPDMNKISPDAGTQPIDASVAYYISADVLNKDVTTPGGGGDKVQYKPYKDVEAAFYKMLTNVFTHVTKTITPTPPAGDNVKVCRVCSAAAATTEQGSAKYVGSYAAGLSPTPNCMENAATVHGVLPCGSI